MQESELRGRIFDIQRFSTHDGPGIRTNVFLKGCPLECQWCQNPEGIDPNRNPIWVSTYCIMCGTCARASRAGSVEMTEAGVLVHPEREDDFDRLIDLCPSGALRWNSEELTSAEVMDRVRSDKPFYVHGGGGVTLSGGDPLQQADFAVEILMQCREERIHTAVETELMASWNVVERVMQYTDMLYADIKLMDPEKAVRYTGACPDRIFKNVERLLSGPYRERVTVRTPLIPGITATAENIGAIAGFLSGLWENVTYELINYNPLASAKYTLIGAKYAFDRAEPLTDAEVQCLMETARGTGLKNVVRDR